MKKTTPATPTTSKVASKKLTVAEFMAREADRAAERMEEGEGDEEDGGGKIYWILKLYTNGYTKKEIIVDGGFNRNTVYRQTGEYDKLRKAPATHYQGFEIFEMRVKRVMGAKKLDRAEVIKYIYAKDLE